MAVREIEDGRSFVVRMTTAAWLVIHEDKGGPVEVSLAFTRSSCNPRRLAYLARQGRPVVAFVQDVEGKAFLGCAVVLSCSASLGEGEQTSEPPATTRDRFPEPVTCQLRTIMSRRVPFSLTDAVANPLHPPGNKSVSQAVMGQELAAEAAKQLWALLSQPQAREADKKMVAQRAAGSVGESNCCYTSEETDPDLLWKGMLAFVTHSVGAAEVLHASPVGSRRYGLETSSSDVDLYVVCLLPLASFCSVLRPSFDVLGSPDNSKPDYAIVEAHCFCRMLLEGDPRAVESLFVPHPFACAQFLMQPLLDRRSQFLTRRVVDRMIKDACSRRKHGALLPSSSAASSSSSAAAAASVSSPPQRQKLLYLVLRLLLHAREATLDGHISIPMRPEDAAHIVALRAAPSHLFSQGSPADLAALAFIDSLLAEIRSAPASLPLAPSLETRDFVESLHESWRRSC